MDLEVELVARLGVGDGEVAAPAAAVELAFRVWLLTVFGVSVKIFLCIQAEGLCLHYGLGAINNGI